MSGASASGGAAAGDAGQPQRWAPGPASAEELKEILQHQLDHLQLWQLELQQQLQLLHQHQPPQEQPPSRQPTSRQRQGPGRPPAAQPRRAEPEGQQALCSGPPGLRHRGAPPGASAAAPGGAAGAGLPAPGPPPRGGRRPSAAPSAAAPAAAVDAAEDGGRAATPAAPSGSGAPRRLQHQGVPKRVDLAGQFGGGHIEQGEVTTLMIRNIPNLYTRSMLMEELSSLELGDKYDFVYLPIDKGTQWNVGYAFVNFVDPESASRCMSVMTGYKFCRFDCGSSKAAGKLAQVSVAHIQGLERNLQFYSGCAVHSARVQSHRPLALPGKSQGPAAPTRRQRRRRARRHGRASEAGAEEPPAPGAAAGPTAALPDAAASSSSDEAASELPPPRTPGAAAASAEAGGRARCQAEGAPSA